MRRISGPLLDRLDLRVEMTRVRAPELLDGPPPESSATVAARIAAARERSLSRNRGRLNAELSGPELTERCRLTGTAREHLLLLAEARGMTARGVHRIMRVARSIADADGAEDVDEAAVLAAADLRDPAARAEPGLAA